MKYQSFWRLEPAAGLFLVLSFVANLAGVVMFSIRGGASGGAPPSFTYYLWERGLLMAAIVLAAIGFMLLEDHVHTSAGRVLGRVGATAYLVAGILGLTAEALDLAGMGQNLYPLIVVYVVLAFLAQAAIGGALRQSGLLAPWVGWVTILWNLVWLVVLPVITPHDIYFPILHHLMLLLIGAPLLRSALSPQDSIQQTEQPKSANLY